MKTFDYIVWGVGGMGSSACYHLARRGKSVLGIEQFTKAHDRGSSFGETRLIRKAYFEHPDYVPLLQRSYELWDELCDRSGKELLHRTGLVIFGPPQGAILNGIRKSAKLHGLVIEELVDDIAKRFPDFKVPMGYHGIYEPEGGFLEVENCVRAHSDEAIRSGATLAYGETVRSWKPDNGGVSVETDRGSYHAKKLIITAGAWSRSFLPQIKVHRAPLFWFKTEKGLDTCFAFDHPYGFIYGFPALDGFLKVAHHKPLEVVTDLASPDRHIHESDTVEVRRCLRECLPGVSEVVQKSAVCLYEMSPDEHFIIDRHPECPEVVFAAGFSGHGFKFASVIGEILADLAIDGRTRHPIGFLKQR